MPNDYEPDPREKPLAWEASLNLGGGGGTGQVYIGRYPNPPDDTSEAAISYPTGGGSIVQWDVPSQAWV